MELINYTIVFFAWFIVVLLVLRFTPAKKIAAMASFFQKVLPKVPITKIIDLFRKK